MAQQRSISAEELARLEPFSSLAPSAVQRILEASRLVELRPKQRLSAQARDPQGESYCFVLAGQMAIVLGPAAAPSAPTEDPNSQFIGYFVAGELFSDGYRDVAPGDAGPVLDCAASTAVRLLVTPVAMLHRLLCDHRDWTTRVAHAVTISRQRFVGQQEPTRRVVQDFFLRGGYGSSRRVRVAEMSHCLDCDKCERACAKRHGQVRMSRAHARLGRLAIQRFCVNCTDQSCLAACAFGGLVVGPGGEIQVTANCNGCGACARRCAFGAISMIESGAPTPAAPRAAKLAVKCDNCAGFPDRACLRACPTATMVELSPHELFFEPGAAEQGKFSASAFVDGVAEHRARARRHGTARAILACALILVLIGTGLEALLRRVWPAHSLAAMLGPMLGDSDSVWYKPSRGYGHGLGYVGTVFMLLTLFYPLRTRLGLLKNWGVQSTWMSVHLWVGFIGATLVTYHSALQLGRWVGLACFAMWLVVLSGVVGRYLYGMMQSGLGLLDFDRYLLRTSVYGEGVLQVLGPRYAAILTAKPEKPGSIFTEMFVMLGHELRDFLTGLRLRLGGLSHLPTREARRQALHLFTELAAYRRSCRYLESARRLLRYWNWVHIILTITMFVLAGVHITYGFMYKAV